LLPMKKRSSFIAASRSRRRWAQPGMVVQARRRDAADAPVPDDVIRFGLTASKKVGKAVVRNQARRRLRAVARTLLSAHGPQGYDFVLVARLITPTRPFAELLGDLETALKRLKLWRD